MNATYSSETLVITCMTIRYHRPEDHNLNYETLLHYGSWLRCKVIIFSQLFSRICHDPRSFDITDGAARLLSLSVYQQVRSAHRWEHDSNLDDKRWWKTHHVLNGKRDSKLRNHSTAAFAFCIAITRYVIRVASEPIQSSDATLGILSSPTAKSICGAHHAPPPMEIFLGDGVSRSVKLILHRYLAPRCGLSGVLRSCRPYTIIWCLVAGDTSYMMRLWRLLSASRRCYRAQRVLSARRDRPRALQPIPQPEHDTVTSSAQIHHNKIMGLQTVESGPAERGFESHSRSGCFYTFCVRLAVLGGEDVDVGSSGF
jgi:hypothetical protein